LIATTEQLAQTIGVQAACDVLAVPRGSLYRLRQPQPELAPVGVAVAAEPRRVGADETETAQVAGSGGTDSRGTVFWIFKAASAK